MTVDRYRRERCILRTHRQLIDLLTTTTITSTSTTKPEPEPEPYYHGSGSWASTAPAGYFHPQLSPTDGLSGPLIRPLIHQPFPNRSCRRLPLTFVLNRLWSGCNVKECRCRNVPSVNKTPTSMHRHVRCGIDGLQQQRLRPLSYLVDPLPST